MGIGAWAACCSSLLQLPDGARRARRAAAAACCSDRRTCATVLRNFGPVFVGRGVVQISAYVDTLLASLLPTGAVAALTYAQMLYTLPVSLFGMSVSAAELPEMASATGTEEERAAHLRARLESGLRQIAFFVVPSAVAFVALGDVVAGALFQSGEFTREMTALRLGHPRGRRPSGCWPPRWAGSTPRRSTRCTTPGRRSASPSCASGSRRLLLGYLSARCTCRALLGLERRWGAAGLTLASGLAAGWSSCCCGARSTGGSARPACRPGWLGRSGARRPRRAGAAGGCSAWCCRLGIRLPWPRWCSARSALVYFGVGLGRSVCREARALLRRSELSPDAPWRSAVLTWCNVTRMTAPRLPDALQRKLDTLPDGPGVYLWKDAAGEVLYVGKAKRLR